MRQEIVLKLQHWEKLVKSVQIFGCFTVSKNIIFVFAFILYPKKIISWFYALNTKFEH